MLENLVTTCRTTCSYNSEHKVGCSVILQVVSTLIHDLTKIYSFQQLKTDMVRAAQVGAAAQAVRLEQKLEDEILTTAVKKLAAHRGDKVKQAEDLRELRELVRRDKRAVEVLSNVLGSSSGVSLENCNRVLETSAL